MLDNKKHPAPAKEALGASLRCLPVSASSETRSSPSFSRDTGAGRLEGESLRQVMETYVRYYASGDGHTARAKRYDLQHFLEFLAGSKARIDFVLVSDWTLQRTKDFLDYRLGLGESPATVARRLATIKHFGRTLAERVPNYINPAREAKGPVLHSERPHGLSEEEVDLLRSAAQLEIEEKPESFGARRNQCMLELLLATGLRADEVRLLNLSQITQDFSWLRNVKTKGKKFRNVYLDSHIRPILSSYLIERDREILTKFPTLGDLSDAEKGRYPVFVSLYRALPMDCSSLGLSPKTVWRIISHLGRKAQSLSDQRISALHPHVLRHTFAHGLLDTSKDIRLVAQALGHSDVRTTMRYTERTDDEIAAAIESKLKNPRK